MENKFFRKHIIFLHGHKFRYLIIQKFQKKFTVFVNTICIPPKLKSTFSQGSTLSEFFFEGGGCISLQRQIRILHSLNYFVFKILELWKKIRRGHPIWVGGGGQIVLTKTVKVKVKCDRRGFEILKWGK